MPIIINNNIQNNSPKSDLHKYLKDGMAPYNDAAEVNATIFEGYRYPGLTVLIDNGTTRREYWYKAGTTDADLVEKSMVIQSGTNEERPPFPIVGEVWHNTTTGAFEGYNGAEWLRLSYVQYMTAGNYFPNDQGAAYTGATDGEAKLADLNALRVAYETLRLDYEGLRQTLILTGIIREYDIVE